MHRNAPAAREVQRPRQILGERALSRLVLLASLPIHAALPLQAAPDLTSFPPAAEFRSLQLITMACSRENTAETCGQARKLADPLLDHPRLPASCKDALWGIVQRAVVAASNNLERRDGIDRVARRLTVVCRQQLPAAQPSSEDGPPRPRGGLNLINPSQN